MISATYSPEDNKLRLSSGERLPQDVVDRLKAVGYRWAPGQKIWIAPMWTPCREDIARELAGQIDDEDSSLMDRAEARAERFESYHEARKEDAAAALAVADGLADMRPLGQPILIGHHSEKMARRHQEKIENAMRRGVEAFKTAEYWTRRAAAAISHAKFKEAAPVRARRIKGLESDQRKQQRVKDHALSIVRILDKAQGNRERVLYVANASHASRCFPVADFPRQPGQSTYEGSQSVWSALDKNIITPEVADRILREHAAALLEHAERWLTHYANRLAYERAMLADSADPRAAIARGENRPEKGGAVRCWASPGNGRLGSAWSWVVKVNRVSVTVWDNWGNGPDKEGGRNFTRNINFTELTGVMSANDVDAARQNNTLRPTQDGVGFWLVPAEDNRPEPVPTAPTVQDVTPDASPDASPVREPDDTQKQAEPVAPTTYTAAAADDVTAVFNDYAAAVAAANAALSRRTHNRPYAQPSGWYSKRMGCDVWIVLASPNLCLSADGTMRDYTKPAPEPVDDLAARAKAAADTLKAGGVKVIVADQLFPTPADLARRVVELADVQPGQRVLEPSAGTGNLVSAVLARFTGAECGRIVAIEINADLAGQLTERRNRTVYATDHNYAVQCADFLECVPQMTEESGPVDALGLFDRIVMNPPFAKRADVRHIRHARRFLKPGGRLVAICAAGPVQREELADADEWIDLPAGSFAESGTNVNAAIVVYQH